MRRPFSRTAGSSWKELTWIGTGKTGANLEEGWTLLPNGKELTVGGGGGVDVVIDVTGYYK